MSTSCPTVSESQAAPAKPVAASLNLVQLRRRLFVNAASNIVRYAVFVVATFVTTPFIVRSLGDAAFGFWTVVLSFVGYAGILELGVQSGVAKFVAQFRATHQIERLSELLSTALMFFLVAGGVAASIVVVLLLLTDGRLASDEMVTTHVGALCALLAVDVALVFMMSFASGILYGAQRYHAKNVVDTAVLAVNALLIWMLLQPQALLTIAAIKLATDAMTLIATVVLCRPAVEGVRWSPRNASLRSFRELFSFAGRILVSSTAVRLTTNCQPLIIAHAISSAAVTMFSIPMRLVGFAREICTSLTLGFMPAFSHMQSAGQDEGMRDTYLRYSRYTLLAWMPALAFVLILGPSFISLWIGPSYADAGRSTLYLLTAAAFVEGFQPLSWRFLIGVGHLNAIVAGSVSASIATIVSCILLAPWLGIAGVALSAVIGAVIVQTVSIVTVSRYFKCSPLELVTKIHVRPILASAVLLAVAWGLTQIVGVVTYAELVLVATIAVSLYALAAMVFGLESLERRAVWRRLTSAVARS